MKIKRFLTLVKKKLRSRGIKRVCCSEEDADVIAKKIIKFSNEELVMPVFNDGMEYLFFTDNIGSSKKKRR